MTEKISTICDSVNKKDKLFISKIDIPKEITQQVAFLKEYPEFDGRNTLIAIIDTGVDPSLPGFQRTTTGLPKIVDCLDLTGAGDVDTSTIKAADENGILIGLTERELKIPKSWKNPSGKWHLGKKPIYELYCTEVMEKIKNPIIPDQKMKKNSLIAEVCRELEKFKKIPSKIANKIREENILPKMEYLESIMRNDSPIADCIVWHDGETLKAYVDTSCSGDLENAKVMSSFREAQEWEYISQECMVAYCVTIYDDGNLLEICVPYNDHGSHVAQIAAAHFPDNPDKNGLAPGAQIVSFCIDDGKESYVNTQAFIRAIKKSIELKVDVINYSFTGTNTYLDDGNVSKLIKECVEKHGIIFVTAAGNLGPALSTVGLEAGKDHPSVINVGAYLTSDMKKNLYKLFVTDDSLVFPFSSRGPCNDGSVGVCISAPGAAIAGVPMYSLNNPQLKQGTSMSSPNACGNIACLISGMKNKKIKYSPFQIKLALINTAMLPPDHDTLSVGYGILQLKSAFEFFLTSMNLIPINLTDIKIDINGKRGIYLREKEEICHRKKFMVNVVSEFNNSEDMKEEINFKPSFILKISDGAESFVKIPKSSRKPSEKFYFQVNTNKLEPGKVHFGGIYGFHFSKPELGPLFRIPITIIIPEEINQEMDYGYRKDFIMEPSLPQRVFLIPPIGSTQAIVTLFKQELSEGIPLKLQYSHSSADALTFSEIYEIYLEGDSSYGFFVSSNATIELCLTQCWSFSKQSNIKMEIKFIGYDVKDLILSSTNSINKITFKNNFHFTSIKPSLKFTKICQSLNVEDASIETFDDRKEIDDGPKSFCLLLTYKLNVIKKNTFMFTLKGISEYFKYLDSISYQINTKSKINIYTFYKPRYTLLKHGIYEICVEIRNSNLQILEKLKAATLLVDESIAPFEANLYHNADLALKERGKKNEPKIYQPRQKANVYVASIPTKKLPASYPDGSYLEGTFSLFSDFEKFMDESFANFKVRYDFPTSRRLNYL